MSLITGDNSLIEEELKIVVVGEPSTGKVYYNNILSNIYRIEFLEILYLVLFYVNL